MDKVYKVKATWQTKTGVVELDMEEYIYSTGMKSALDTYEKVIIPYYDEVFDADKNTFDLKEIICLGKIYVSNNTIQEYMHKMELERKEKEYRKSHVLDPLYPGSICYVGENNENTTYD